MRKSIVAGMVTLLMMMPWVVRAQAEGEGLPRYEGGGLSGAPPIAQPLVREGDFAMDLMEVLGLGPAESEAQAETILSSLGIAPRNGWISDYPVTPDIFGEVWESVGAAADAGRLPMGREEAQGAVASLSEKDGMPVMSGAPGVYGEGAAPADYSGYPDYEELMPPSVVEEYYHASGPPVVTYYPPPWDYYYLYAWVPSPFWWSGWWLPGFFVLHDFHVYHDGHRRHRHHHHRGDGYRRPRDSDTLHARNPTRRVVSNRVVDRDSNRVRRIDPATRATGGTISTAPRNTPRRPLDSPETRDAARSILRRNLERGTSGSEVRRVSPPGRTSPARAPQVGRPERAPFTEGGPQAINGRTAEGRRRAVVPNTDRSWARRQTTMRPGGDRAVPTSPQGFNTSVPRRPEVTPQAVERLPRTTRTRSFETQPQGFGSRRSMVAPRSQTPSLGRPAWGVEASRGSPDMNRRGAVGFTGATSNNRSLSVPAAPPGGGASSPGPGGGGRGQGRGQGRDGSQR